MEWPKKTRYGWETQSLTPVWDTRSQVKVNMSTGTTVPTTHQCFLKCWRLMVQNGRQTEQQTKKQCADINKRWGVFTFSTPLSCITFTKRVPRNKSATRLHRPTHWHGTDRWHRSDPCVNLLIQVTHKVKLNYDVPFFLQDNMEIIYGVNWYNLCIEKDRISWFNHCRWSH